MERLSWPEFQELSTYNSERARGLVHTDSWRDRMRTLQERYDAAGFEPLKEWKQRTR